jgi:hypothetical protein
MWVDTVWIVEALLEFRFRYISQLLPLGGLVPADAKVSKSYAL